MSADEPQALARMLELSAVFMALTFVIFVAYAMFAAAVRNHVISRPRLVTWLRRTFAGAFVALGAKLAPHRSVDPCVVRAPGAAHHRHRGAVTR